MSKKSKIQRQEADIRCLKVLQAYRPDSTMLNVDAAYNLERLFRKLMTDRCNAVMADEVYQKKKAALVKRLTGLFGGTLPDGLFINTDPRGYSIKFEDNIDENHPARSLFRDMGGYYIFATNHKKFDR